MSFFKSLFGGGKSEEERSHQMPSGMVAKEFGEINVKRVKSDVEVMFTILMEPTGTASEGWQTGVAIDASGSMSDVFGKGISDGPQGDPPTPLLQEYQTKGWLELIKHQGETYVVLSDEAKADLVQRGYRRWTTNEIEPLARKVTAYLASSLDADGGTTVIYWACGDGSQIEVIGDLTAEDCERASFTGPTKVSFGAGTVLAPAVKYFADRFADAKNGMYIFITDGELQDLQEVKKYTIQLCRDIQAKRRNPLKCVLIGIGEGVNEEQMEELDDLDSGTNVDVWDHKMARDMRTIVEIFAEVVSEHMIVAPSARLVDSSGQVVRNFSDGLPAKVTFTMPAASEWFELEVSGQRIRQSVVISS
ncbi:MAG: VWA domain-containing protein [Pyrinomonadaceae bacterium]|nr:VWA domain-containing protein [Pyrinomonadaceae bacterium]